MAPAPHEGPKDHGEGRDGADPHAPAGADVLAHPAGDEQAYRRGADHDRLVERHDASADLRRRGNLDGGVGAREKEKRGEADEHERDGVGGVRGHDGVDQRRDAAQRGRDGHRAHARGSGAAGGQERAGERASAEQRAENSVLPGFQAENRSGHGRARQSEVHAQA